MEYKHQEPKGHDELVAQLKDCFHKGLFVKIMKVNDTIVSTFRLPSSMYRVLCSLGVGMKECTPCVESSCLKRTYVLRLVSYFI